jgi:hypothetical protein
MESVSMEGSYEGSLSPLTRYGTLNVSTSRIPRKKRGKGNAHLYVPRTRVYGYAPTPEGEAMAAEGICSVLVHKPGMPSVTVPASHFHAERTYSKAPASKVTMYEQPESARLASIREGEIYS